MDLTELRPSVGHNLQALLDYEGDDFDEMFELTFEVRTCTSRVASFPGFPHMERGYFTSITKLRIAGSM